MPWEVLSDHPDCSGFAVVKSDTGKLVACHETKAGAEAQVRALYAAEPSAGQEHRLVEFRDAEVRGRNFRGVAAVFDSPWGDNLTEALGYVETIARGAFRKALSRGGNVPLLGAHRRHELLASTAGGTLQLAEDGHGLAVEADLPENYLGEYYREMIARNDIRGMSYGMETRPGDSIISREGSQTHRRIANIQKLLDVTLTWEPAYPATVAELRAVGFAVTPLQELTGGLEEQTGDAVAENHPPGETVTIAHLEARMVELKLDELEKGGWELCEKMNSAS